MPHHARVWNHLLGGKDSYPSDQQMACGLLALVPGLVRSVRASRYFLARALWYLARDHHIHQFIDIGTGLPCVDNTH